MAGRVRLRGFQIGVLAESNGRWNEGKSGTDSKDESILEGRFKATRMWNGIMRRFRNGMPLKRHRRQLRTFESCFTGREAVDFLMNELPKFISEDKEITRKNCALLLDKFMKRKMFCSARSESDFMEHFKENEIYRFCDIAEEKLASTPVLVRRAASFNERYSLGGCGERSGSDTNAAARPNKVEFSQREHKMMPGRFVIPSKMSTSPLAKSRRLSSSHGNLPSMVSPRMFNSTETVISTKVEVDYNLKETEEEEERNLSGRIRQAEKIVDRDSNLVQVTTKPTVGLPPNVVSVANIRTFGKLVQSNTPVSNEERIVRTEQQKEDSTGAVKRNSPVRVVRCPLTECDVCDVWKDAVLSRLRTLLGVASLRGIFEFEFSGYDVKWNCEKVGRRGIVYVKEEDDTLSTYLIAMMRYLSQWPFDRKFADKQYDGFELNVFENVCEHFAKGCPLLPTLLALAILNIVEVIRKRNTAAPMVVSPLIGTDSMPADDVSPLTRYATYSNSVEGQTPSALQVNTEATPRAFMRASHARNSAAATQSRRPIHPRLEDGSSRASVMSPFALPTESTTSESSRIKLKEYESVLARLPGLHHSPELLERMRELATAVKTPPLRVTSISSSSLFKTPKLGLSPLVAGIAREDESDLIWCVALILLTIPPPTRRRLHFLVRFMQRVCKNHCLHLDTHRENRYVVLERLSESIIAESDLISSVQCLHLVAFLVDNESELFAVPPTFKADVDESISAKCKRKASLPTETKEERELGSNSVSRPSLQFCEPVDPKEYNEQREKGIESHLLALLDEIVANENLSVEERKKQLKKFKKTYPHIYEKRFPSPKFRPRKPRTPSIFDKLRVFSFK